MFDLADYVHLGRVKTAAIDLARGLESSTDDKVYLYAAGKTGLARWLGEVVAEIASFGDMAPIDPEDGLMSAAVALSALDRESYDKHVYYVTDRFRRAQVGRVRRALEFELRHETGCSFGLVGVGRGCSPALSEAASSHPRCSYRHVALDGLTSTTLEESFFDASNAGTGP